MSRESGRRRKYVYKAVSKSPFKVGRGNPLPFGSTVTNEGVNFALFSRHAIRVSLVLFDCDLKILEEIKLSPKINKTGDVWHILVYRLDPDICYGYYVDGPFDPNGAGHRFNSDILLLDPYAHALTSRRKWGEDSNDSVEVKNHLKRACSIDSDDIAWGNDKPLNIPLQDSIIYELHVRGYTIDESSGVEHPGTYKGLIEKIPYLKELGITAVELMPVTEFDENEGYFSNPDTGEQLRNYWGYSPIAFFAPKAAYAANLEHKAQLKEFAEMVKTFHKANIEVILDVVFNHTAEGGDRGHTLSFKGLDNTIYYMLEPHNKDYMNYSGCGNTMNCNHPIVRNLIIDCLHFWVTEMHVDGFRFDLASILGRDQNGNVLSNPPLIEKIAEDPILANTKIIAEAWDAAGLYQVGSFYKSRWAEWNGKFRDDIRRFIRGDMSMIASLATRFAGSSDLYHNSGRRPYHSINFITSHDGFTLMDLVSYAHKHNRTNGEDNRDGTNDNFSVNCGVEGHTDNESIINMRLRLIKSFTALLLLSQGVPMILAGDEIGRTQHGNNNAYCQDNKISWVEWTMAEKNHHLLRFFKLLIRYRRLHPIFRRGHFFVGEETEGSKLKDITWMGLHLDKHSWEKDAKCLSILLNGMAISGKQKDDDFFFMINGDNNSHDYSIPEPPSGKKWLRIIDTHLPSPEDIQPEDTAIEISPAQKYNVKDKTIVVLISKPQYYSQIRQAITEK